MFWASAANPFGRNFHRLLLLLAMGSALGIPRALPAYHNMGGDRILLMNNDSRTKEQGGITGQGYWDTNTTAGVSYWTHEPPFDNPTVQTLQQGLEHVLHAPDGTPWWRLVDCRAGYVVETCPQRNTLPYSAAHAMASEAPSKTFVYEGRTVATVSNAPSACVILRKSTKAAIYSPFYRDGIGTLYFDTVNAYLTEENIQVQIATNLTETARLAGDIAFEDVDTRVDFVRWDDYYDWQVLPLTVLDVKDGVVQETREGVTDLRLNVQDTGSTHYARVRTQLNYYGPIRFRICRGPGTVEPESPDRVNLVLVDNIIASYPPMTVVLNRAGGNLDESPSGAGVVGCIGDFDKAFPSVGDTRLKTRLSFSWVTNFQDTALNLRMTRPNLHYRWRYLDQRVGPWRTVPLVTNENSTARVIVDFQSFPQNTQLVAEVEGPCAEGMGDLEYYYEAGLFAPYYETRDYANDRGPVFGWIPGTQNSWREAILAVTNRLVSAGLKTAAQGCDYFTRIRPGASDYKWVKLCAKVSTDGRPEELPMELVGDHTWRYHFAVPTNLVGAVLAFHFRGEEVFKEDEGAAFQSRTNTWSCNMREVPRIPYASRMEQGGTDDVSCVLDSGSTHVMIVFNDETSAFSVSHASYQNFNVWTDATRGYGGHAKWNEKGAVGVSDAKRRYEFDVSTSQSVLMPEDSRDQSVGWVYSQGVVTNRTGSPVLMFQPRCGVETTAMGLRTPFLDKGLSLFSFDYEDAEANTRLLLQICTNLTATGNMGDARMSDPSDSTNWTTVADWDFSKMTEAARRRGTLTHEMSLRAPVAGFIRLVVPHEVIQYGTGEEDTATGKKDYGQVVITRAYCSDEPVLDSRSWYAWNFHSVGWNTADKRFANLSDAPNGLSGSLNFSSLASENDTSLAATQGIGFADLTDISALTANNAFIQCPPMTNGIGSLRFLARTFETNATRQSSWITLYGSDEPDDDQVVSPDSWKRICDFEITNTTYQAYQWKSMDDRSPYHAVRLEVANSRHGRTGYSRAEPWETPKTNAQLQRVLLDEISVSEPLVPMYVKCQSVRPFRLCGSDYPSNVVIDVTGPDKQPLLGESWGLQCTIGKYGTIGEIEDASIVVWAAFKRGVAPWGFENWSNAVTRVKLERIPGTMTFHSSTRIPGSVITAQDTPVGTYPENVWQYYVWCEYDDKDGNKHRHGLDAFDWEMPSWYYGMTDLNEMYRAQGFAGYTILDAIPPKRAWINEVNLCDTGYPTNTDGERQFVEIAAPRGVDLTAWSLNVMGSMLNKGTLATYGYGDAKLNPNPKVGFRMGVDWTNDYTVVALRSPAAAKAGTLGAADGTWNSMDAQTLNKLNMAGNSALYNYESYGLELVRPSGVIEHQIIVEGTNYYTGTDWEAYGSGTNLLARALKMDGQKAQWIFAGVDVLPTTLGVFKSHGEDASCWTNRLISTPVELNMFEDGARQAVDPDWSLPPGNISWIITTVFGDHVRQSIGGRTNKNEILSVRKGTSVNVTYGTDKWWALASVSTNGEVVAASQGRADRADNHVWTFELKNVTGTIDVRAEEKPGALVSATGLAVNDPYLPAIMAWLEDRDESKGLYLAKHIPLSGDLTRAQNLGLKEMYWLDIDPTEPGWAIWAGMGGIGSPSCVPISPVVDATSGTTNMRVVVTCMITNLTKNTSSPNYGSAGARAPDRLNGLDPGCSSLAYGAGLSTWRGATFKICGALQRTDAADESRQFRPLRAFVFAPGSFDANFRTTIDLPEPHTPASPGWSYGWGDYPDVPIFFNFRMDDAPGWANGPEPELLTTGEGTHE